MVYKFCLSFLVVFTPFAAKLSFPTWTSAVFGANNTLRMTNLILHLLVSAVAFLITSKLITGFRVKSFGSAFVAAIVVGVANAILWWILFVLTLPLTVLTLGLFLFVLNGLVLRICASVVSGFDIDSWGAAIIGSMVLSFVSLILHELLV